MSATERYTNGLSEPVAEALIESTISLVAARTPNLDELQFARLVGRLMSHMTFNQRTVTEMVRALGPVDFADFCDMVPGACNARAAIFSVAAPIRPLDKDGK